MVNPDTENLCKDVGYSLKKRRVYIWGVVDDCISRKVVKQLQYLKDSSNDPVYIYINSEGGALGDAFTIVDEMMSLKEQNITVYTINIGSAYSAAAFILANGSKGFRLMRPSATTMLHPCSYSLDYDYSENQAKVTIFLKKITEYYNKIMADACSCTNYKKFLKDISKGLWMNAEESVKYNVVDKISFL